MKEDKYIIKARSLHHFRGQPKMLAFTREQLLSNIITAHEAGREELRLAFKYLLEMFDEY